MTRSPPYRVGLRGVFDAATLAKRILDKLTALERGEHLMRRKAIYEELWPEAKQGGALGKPGGGKVARTKEETVSSFASDTAAKTGLTALERGEHLARR